MNLKAWEDFCDELKNLGSIIENNAPDYQGMKATDIY